MARFICAFVLSVVSVTALGAETIELGPSDWRRWGPGTSQHTLDGLRTSYGQPVRMGPGGGSINVIRNPVIPYGSIGNGLKGLARATPGAIAASALMSGLFYGMDWLFDEGQWVKMDEASIDPLPGSMWYGTGGWPVSESGPGGPQFASAEAACRYFIGGNISYSYHSTVLTSQTSANCLGRYGNNQNASNIGSVGRNQVNCPPGSVGNPLNGGCLAQLPVPLTDSDYSELTAKLPSIGAPTVGGVADELMTRQGAPLPGYTDTNISGPSSVSGPSTTTTTTGPEGNITSTSTTTTNISYGPTTITTTNTTTTNTYTNGEPSGTTTTTETPSPDLVTEPTPSPGSTSLDIPTDCEFMPTVCAFLDWFKEPVPMPEPDLPVVVDHDFEREYEMNLTAECPPPYTVDTQLFGTLSISWAPFCDLAGLMKPLVVGSAFLMSAFITLGIGRGRA